MSLNRRGFLKSTAALAAAGLTTNAEAQPNSYPMRPVRILVGYPPGGFTDATARLMGPWLSERLGQQFTVENRPGASSNIATGDVVRSAPDGYTLLEVADANAYNATLYGKLNFNFIRDIAPVASIVHSPFVMVVNPSFPAQTLEQFIAHAREKPSKLTMAASGPGSPSQLFGELFKAMAHVDLITVQYRGVGPALPDLLSGRVDVIFLPVSSAISQIRSSKLRALGVTTVRRLAVLPEVPPISDFVPRYDAVSWSGIGAPANTPAEIIAILNKEINAALIDPKFKAKLSDLGLEPFASSPAEFREFIIEHTKKWEKVIRTAGIQAE